MKPLTSFGGESVSLPSSRMRDDRVRELTQSTAFKFAVINEERSARRRRTNTL